MANAFPRRWGAPLRLAGLVCGLLATAACGADAPREMVDTPPVAPTLTELQTEIFSESCALRAGCHTHASPTNGLDLSAGNTYGTAVNQPSLELPEFNRVTPGNPDDSYLFMKLIPDSRVVGSRMPALAPKLDDVQIEMIRAWIEAGALDN